MENEFGSLSDDELTAAVYELTDLEMDLSEKVAHSLTRKNEQIPGVGGMIAKKVRSLQYQRRKIQHEETALALEQATAEQIHRIAIKDDLPKLLAEETEVQRLLAEDAAFSEQIQRHVAAIGAAVLAKEKGEAHLRRLESSLESRHGSWRGAVSFAGSVLRPNDLARALKTSLCMALKPSRTYSQVAQISGLCSPKEIRRDFSVVMRSNGERLLQKFREEIRRIETRKEVA